MKLFETAGDLARGLDWLTERWHPLILHPPPWVTKVSCLPGEVNPWSCRVRSPQIETALAFLDGLRQMLGADALPVWKLERLLEDYRFSPARSWEFRDGFLLEWWKAEPYAIEDLLEGRALPPGRRPFVLVYAQGLELWSRPPQARLRFRDEEEAAEIGWSEERNTSHG
jgi:hypothetical protein